MKLNKKAAAFDQLGALVVPLVVIAVVLVIGFLIMSEVFDQAITYEDGAVVANCSTYACNGTRETIDAMAGIPTWLPIIVIVVIGSILIGLVSMFRGK